MAKTPDLTEQPLVLVNFSGEALIPQSAEQQKEKALCAAKKIITVVDDSSQLVAVSAMRDLATIRKGVEAARKAIVAPVNALRDKINTIAADFVSSVEKDEKRLQGLVNHHQLKLLDAQKERDQEAERVRQAEMKRQQQEAAKADELLKQAEKLRLKSLQAESSKAAQKLVSDARKLEEQALEKQLESEESALAAEATGGALQVQTDKPKGLTVRRDLNFQVTDPILFIQAYPEFWKWHEDIESLKLKRRELREELNNPKGKFAKTQYPEETPIDEIPRPPGLRVFDEVKSHVR